jgi:hypothetical protein
MKIVCLLLPLLTLAGCNAASPASRATPSQEVACRQRADQMFQAQNRGNVYATDQYVSSTRDSPFGGAVPTSMTSTLSDRFARDQMYDGCLNAGGPRPASPAPAPKPATATP